MTQLLSSIINIPERVHRGDFVLKLTEGVEHPAETLASYVVTEQLARAFDDALGFIKGALDARTSKAAYLHGSFGSGKSHFMAVLNLMLSHHATARGVPELAPVVARHATWLDGKRFLLVPYHLIGATSLESAILGQYVEHVRKLHPEAPVPAVFAAEALFQDAVGMRAKLGDGQFFAMLNGAGNASGSAEDGWGDLATSWDVQSFERALAAPPKAESRGRLVSDLVGRIFTAYRSVAATGDGEAFVSLDQGLAVLSQHAHKLGYDGLVLFLDELILWLASHISDLNFVNREGQKLAKLVEATAADRPIPIVSFVARQRDLRELVGDHVPGMERFAFGDVLKHWQGRFHLITLEDRNLPAIAERRVLKPRSEAARQILDAAFEETTRVRDDVLSTLLTSSADKKMFRQVYPFSPALVQALVAVSSVLQRERTALKVLVQLLVNQRDTLQVGDLVPVGDLFDVIAENDEPFTEQMRAHFENAKRLHRLKLVPLLERTYGLRHEEVRMASAADPKVRAYRADDRLLKTLLLAALVPEVEAFKALTAGRLAALNHGSIRSPIPGREGQMVLEKCRRWAAEVGELRISEDPNNPTIALQLTGVDIEGIVERARSVFDNAGNRVQLVRKMVFGELGLKPEGDGLTCRHDFLWRGTRRRVDVLFSNVRDLPDQSLRASEEDWKVVVDFPFDEDGHSPQDDQARLEKFSQEGEPTRTVCWMPTFLSLQLQGDLGRLVTLEHLLAGERLNDHTSHLSVVDRPVARSLLENQQSQLRQRLKNVLEGAYAVATADAGTLDTSHGLEQHLVSLDPSFEPRTPVGNNLKEAFGKLLEQMLARQFKAHPDFGEEELKVGQLRKVFDEIRKAAHAQDGRVIVEDRTVRPLMKRIAQPLKLGEMHETPFILGRHWMVHFEKKAAEAGGAFTVANLRRWMDEPEPMGLPLQVQNLVALTFAEQTDRSFFRGKAVVEGTLDTLADELELREQSLPPSDVWEEALKRARDIFRIEASPLKSAVSVGKLEAELRRAAEEHQDRLIELQRRLQDRMRSLGIEAASTARVRTLEGTTRLIAKLKSSTAEELLATFSRTDLPAAAAAVGTAVVKAPAVKEALERTNWTLVETAVGLADHRAAGARLLRDKLVAALNQDEIAVGLASVLRDVENAATRLLAEPAPVVAAPLVPPVARPSTAVPRAPSRVTLALSGERDSLDISQAQEVLGALETLLAQHPGATVRLSWKLERRK